MDVLDYLVEALEKGLDFKTVDPELLAYLMGRRDALIMELRSLDRLLMAAGRLERETIPRKIRR